MGRAPLRRLVGVGLSGRAARARRLLAWLAEAREGLYPEGKGLRLGQPLVPLVGAVAT